MLFFSLILIIKAMLCEARIPFKCYRLCRTRLCRTSTLEVLLITYLYRKTYHRTCLAERDTLPGSGYILQASPEM